MPRRACLPRTGLAITIVRPTPTGQAPLGLRTLASVSISLASDNGTPNDTDLVQNAVWESTQTSFDYQTHF